MNIAEMTLDYYEILWEYSFADSDAFCWLKYSKLVVCRNKDA